MRATLMAVVAVLIFIGGWMFGASNGKPRTDGHAEASSPPNIPIQQNAPAVKSQIECAEPPGRGRIELLERALRQATAKIEELRVRTDNSKAPDPTIPMRVAFPADIGVAYQPEGFKQVVTTSIAECHLPLSLSEIDCSEFPCVAWTSWTPTSNAPPLDLTTCKPWTDAFGTMTGILRASGSSPLTALYAFPQSAEDRKRVRSRLPERIHEMLVAEGYEE